ncbi:MAG: HD domain-containing protein [Nanoarchaeota archaeon]|nr:HD domain-containing protein [Nanoarchaeota archaeon]
MNLEIISDFVRDFMNHPGHQYSHVLRVYHSALRVAEFVEADEEVLFPAVLLHDIARANEKSGELMKEDAKKIIGYSPSDTLTCHALTGAKWAESYLQNINYNSEKIKNIVYCIKNHRYSTGIIPNIMEAIILQECDKLDALGAIGMVRTLVHYPLINKRLFHSSDPLARHRKLDDDEYAVDHFFVKLLKLKKSFTIGYIKEEAVERHEFMELFLNLLEKQVVKKEDNGVLEFLEVIYDNPGLEHYNLDKPFSCEGDYLVSKLMRYDNNFFIKKFLAQLETEIL